MSNLHAHAMLEFKAMGWLDENDNWTDDMQEMMCEGVLKLLDVFSDEGHSGSTAPYAINLFMLLANYEPLGPLTGEDWEWQDVSDRGDGSILYQNKRCGHVFKEGNGQAYDIDGRVFWEWCKDQETGEAFKSYYTCRDSKVPITFPYKPMTVYEYRYSDADPKGPNQNEDGFL